LVGACFCLWMLFTNPMPTSYVILSLLPAIPCLSSVFLLSKRPLIGLGLGMIFYLIQVVNLFGFHFQWGLMLGIGTTPGQGFNFLPLIFAFLHGYALVLRVRNKGIKSSKRVRRKR